MMIKFFSYFFLFFFKKKKKIKNNKETEIENDELSIELECYNMTGIFHVCAV